jgi:hypothetical protein
MRSPTGFRQKRSGKAKRLFRSELEFERSGASTNELDQNVARVLVSGGILNHLEARMVANLTEAIHESPIEAMKPCQTVKTDVNYQLAATFVTAFLTRWNLSETMRSVRAEIPALLPIKVAKTLVLTELEVRSTTAPLTELLNGWMERGAEIVAANRLIVLRGVDERLAALPPPSRVYDDLH